MTARNPDSPAALIRHDGSPFEPSDLAATVEADFGDSEGRVRFRDANAEAIAFDESARMLIVAGPGTGKSYLFMTRLQMWVERYPDHSIFVSSFVRKLVHDLDNDVERSGLREPSGMSIEVSTLHRIARSILERNGGTSRMPFDRHIRMIGGDWKEVVWDDMVHGVGMDASADVNREEFEAQYHNLAFSDEGPYPVLRGKYEELSRFFNAVGFADSIVYATEALSENAELRQRALWIFDEFQDFNTAEERLVSVCTESAEAVLLAGDDDQAIYQNMKSSHPRIIRSYYGDDSVVNAMLPFCGRSSYHICMSASSFLSHHPPEERIDKVYLPLDDPDEAEKVHVVAATAPSTAVAYIADFIESRRDDLERRKDEMLSSVTNEPYLLVLTHPGNLDPMLGKHAGTLREAVVEWAVSGLEPGPDYLRIKTYVHHKAYPEDNFSLRKVLHYEGYSSSDVAPLIARAIGEGKTLCEVEDRIIASATAVALEVAATVEEGEASPAEIANAIAALVEVDDLDQLASDLESHPMSGGADGDEDLFDAMQRFSPVELMTMSGAKGLSADHVIILGADPVSMNRATPEVFYVALTRARESLHAVIPLGSRGAAGPHDFISALPEQHCAYSKYSADGSETYTDQAAFVAHLRKIEYARGRSRRG